MRDTLRRRLTRTLVLPLLVLYAISGGFAYLVARHYAERVYDLWLYDSVISLAHQVLRSCALRRLPSCIAATRGTGISWPSASRSPGSS